MGELIRSYDWSATPLGPPEQWSQSLKTLVRLMLSSRQPIWLSWGPEQTYLYNDPYLSIIGGKHPRALGKPFKQVWREIWDVVGPMADQALQGSEGIYVEEQLLIMERHGYQEETYYTFSYTGVLDDDGSTGGIFCANTDNTLEVVGGRQLELLAEVARKTLDARSIHRVFEGISEAMASNPLDIPFSLFFVEYDGEEPALLGKSGSWAAESPFLSPKAWDLSASDLKLIPFEGQTQIPTGSWAVSPRQAVITRIPILGVENLQGWSIFGLNPYRPFDAGYRAFIELLAGQVASSVGTAYSYEEEQQRAEELARLDRAKTAFFSNVSHEFRTPITLMIGPLEDILNHTYGDLPSEVEKEVEMAHRNCLRLLRLVNTLLDFSRIEAGRIDASFFNTDVAALTREIASAFRSTFERAGLGFQVDCANLREDFYIDVDMWEKIVLNLLSNAFKFTHKGGVKVEFIELPDALELTVSDTGTGIAASELPKLFDRFHRVEGSQGRTHEGTGIGLALVKELVTQHGGEIWAESVVGEGTRFHVKIPSGTKHLPESRLRSGKVESRPHARAYVEEAMRWLPDLQGEVEFSADSTGPAPLHDRPYILFADDNADMREYVSRLLSENFEVATVADGREALEAIKNRVPDLVLSDVMMPNVDGFELLNTIKNSDLRDIPVILLSARAGEESRIEGIQVGADDYLVKPFGARELVARVLAHVNLTRTRREALQSLRASEERYKLATEAGRVGTFVWDIVTDIFYADPVAALMLDLSAEVGRSGIPIDDIKPAIHPDDIDGLTATILRAVEVGGECFADYRAIGSDGIERWISSRGVVERNEEGVAVRMPGAVTDVSQRRTAELALQQSEAKLRQLAASLEEQVRDRTAELMSANEQLQGFTYSVAHDLRQQIRGINSNASILRQDIVHALNEDNAQTLTRLIESSRRLGTLVDDLLNYARLGKQAPVKADVDLTTVAREIVDYLGETNRCSEAVEFKIAEGLTAKGDPSMLRLVIENLFDNACKYSSREETPQVEFGRDGEAFFVRDNGIGFDMRYVDKLFQPFERLHRHTEYSGTGIGLANVKRIIEKHGGRVWAEGEPGKGSSFFFSLPT